MRYEFYPSRGGRVDITTTEEMSLEMLQEKVGGYIELVLGEKQDTFCVNEDGQLKDLPRNARWPRFVGDVVRGRMVGSQFIGF